MIETLYSQLASVAPLEAAGLVFGLAAVILLIPQSMWTWPAGVAYVACSLLLFWRDALYGQFVLHLFFGAMNLYGWWFWLAGRSQARDAGGELHVSRAAPRLLGTLLGVAALAGLGSAWLTSRYTDASVPYWDNLVATVSFVAMWLSARKYIENWYLWFVINLASAPLFFSQGLYLYALLYLVYIPLAWTGFTAWRNSLKPLPALS